jgi:hypothetical protein
MTYITLILAVFMLMTPVLSYGESPSKELKNDEGATAGRETMRSGISGQALEEKEKQKEKKQGKKAHQKNNKGNNDPKLRGLDRADEVAGEHGAQGRANARGKQSR